MGLWTAQRQRQHLSWELFSTKVHIHYKGAHKIAQLLWWHPVQKVLCQPQSCSAVSLRFKCQLPKGREYGHKLVKLILIGLFYPQLQFCLSHNKTFDVWTYNNKRAEHVRGQSSPIRGWLIHWDAAFSLLLCLSFLHPLITRFRKLSEGLYRTRQHIMYIIIHNII